VDIIVLAQPAPRGTVITESLLAKVPYPQAQMVTGLFFTEMKDVLDKRTRFDLDQGTPLVPSVLTDKPVGSYASLRIPKGQVAVSIPMNRLTSISYALQPGDHVNLIASVALVDLDTQFQAKLPNLSAQVIAPGPAAADGTTPTTSTISIQPGGPGATQGRAELDTTLNAAVYVLPSEGQRPRLVSQTLIQNATVLWVGEFPLDGKLTDGPKPTPTPVPQGQEAAPAAPVTVPDIITLIVTPQDAVTLNYLVLAGAKLNMALRSNGDDQRIATEAVTLQLILDQYSIPNPVKLPIGLEPRKDEFDFPSTTK
jgi:Flp pilus assembly protein CpaB